MSLSQIMQLRLTWFRLSYEKVVLTAKAAEEEDKNTLAFYQQNCVCVCVRASQQCTLCVQEQTK